MAKRPRSDIIFNTSRWITFQGARFLEVLNLKSLRLFFSAAINAQAGQLFEIIFSCFLDNASSGSVGVGGSAYCVSLFQLAQKLPPHLKLIVDPCDSIYSSIGSSNSNALKDYLLAMIQCSEGIFSAAESASTNFSVKYHPQIARQILSERLLESYIRDRFGGHSVRLWRCLVDRGAVEEKYLSKITLIDLKEARERLLQLFSHGFIELQDVPRTADHNPQRTIYLWKYVSATCKDLMKSFLLKGY